MRSKKLISIKGAVSQIKDGMTIGLSGFSYMNPPMEFVREIIRQKKKDLTIVSGPTSGIETDLLIGAGCVKKIITAGVAFEKVAGIAPNFRKSLENNKIEMWECDESMWHMGIKAGIYDVPYMLWKAGTKSSIPDINNDIKLEKIEGKNYLKIPKIQPDLTFLHLGYADEYGNVQLPKEKILGRSFCERLIAESTIGNVFVSVEKIVSNKFILENPERTILKNVFVCKCPNGAHPGASNGFYIPDLDHYDEYVSMCKENRFEDYLKKYVYPEIYPVKKNKDLELKFK